MNTSTLKKNAIALSELNKNMTDNERQFVDAEKKYYKIVNYDINLFFKFKNVCNFQNIVYWFCINYLLFQHYLLQLD